MYSRLLFKKERVCLGFESYEINEIYFHTRKGHRGVVVVLMLPLLLVWTLKKYVDRKD